MSDKLSILIPVYNEISSIDEVLEVILNLDFLKTISFEIICVDDCSTDGSGEHLKKINNKTLKVFFQEKNMGKGAAINRAISEASGDIMIIQDADLEYDPQEYQSILQPLLDKKADVVYGSRYLGGKPRRVLFFWHTFGNKFLTFVSNIFTNLNLTDMETCYKAFTKEAIKNIRITSKRFGIEPELTAKFAKKKLKIIEVPISYFGRSYEEGKKIGWKDGFSAIFHIIKFKFSNRLD